ncbi:uncharacterized protein LOC110768423 [Prunus avium]|uniref:Uncharacterized protein LOC110768423 n=1 Tax=Prunus avium TaxID=42229 RepID=A0A6P5TLI4_PRUAV|nr:uncharacterized protein LOC110768423 [Prunus avium]
MSTKSTCVSQAVRDPQWCATISEEFYALIRNGTWELVPSSPTQNLISCKWVFRIKRHPNSSIDMYKARLMAKGFHQRLGIDFASTFNPVVKPTTIRVVFYLTFTNLWPIHQLDINNAFMDGSISEDLFMIQLLGSSGPMVSIKDLGSLNYFLGVEVVPTASGVFLSQHKYIQELLNKAHMDGAKEVIVPMSTFAHLLVHDGSPTTDAIEYRRPVSSLQYLSITHPDISFDSEIHGGIFDEEEQGLAVPEEV